MNLRRVKNKVTDAGKKVAKAPGIFRQTIPHGVLSSRLMISMSARMIFSAVCLCCALMLAFSNTASAQTNYYNTNGTEYAVIGSLPGDQVFPDAAITTNGGFVVWQDNITDGNGWGISARKLDSTLSGTLSTFRVNQRVTGNQEHARVTMLKNGGAAFVWQGGVEGFQHIYGQFLSPSNTFLTTTDLLVNATTNYYQLAPAIATLNNSNVVVVWSSRNEAGSTSMQDVYGQILSPKGQKIGTEFLVNQFTSFNQRSPAVAALSNGGFVVTWVSEQERQVATTTGTNALDTGTTTVQSAVTATVDVYARLYNSSGTPGNEFLVNTDFRASAAPSVAAATDGSFMIAWMRFDSANPTNSWDIYARPFSSTGVGGTVAPVNTHIYGDQYSPHISSIGLDYMVTWTSLGQDGSREGVYAQFVHNDGTLVGSELRVNTTTIGQQMHPAVTSDAIGQFLVVWTSYNGATNSFDLFAQRYANVSGLLNAMPAPFVYAPFTLVNNVYQPQLQISWAPLLGIAVSNYEVYVNGSGTPLAKLVTNVWAMTAANGLTVSSTNSFQVDYVTTDGRRSPLSSSAIGATWSGLNWGGIPYEWMAQYFGGYTGTGYNTNFWPSAGTLVGPNLNLVQIFVTGGNPLDSSTWLATKLTRTSQGIFLSWNTQPGATYQVQVTTNFNGWSNVGSPRFAASNSDSINVGGNPVGYYRLVLLR